MNLKAGLFQNQQLKLQMTQQLSQAITILQYSTMELNAFLEAKQLENPLIQLEPPKQGPLHQREPQSYKQTGGKSRENTVDWYEYVSVPKGSMSDALTVQLNLKSLTYAGRKVMEELIDSLDDNGYLRIDEDSFMRKHGIDYHVLEYYIHSLQEMEPAGVGARSLQECISLQLERKAGVPPLVKKIVDDHFQAFAEKKWKGIAKELSVQLKEIQRAADFIQRCNPRPGSIYTYDISEYITPELVVEVIDGKVAVSLNDGTTVHVAYNREYTDFLKDHPDKEVQSYLQEKEQDFKWLLQSLRQRKQTILKVGRVLADKQRAFFLKGPTALQPLTLRQVADEIDVHESTISRAVKGKYMQTAYGIFELKYFFTTAIKSVNLEEAEGASATAVKNELQRLIQEEDKKKPLSDQKIVNLLLEKGYDVSRRTIAKYRDQLGIVSSTMRKRYE
ncbi:RNA polymerase factor sigma-54 [Bacillus sp. KH172YL63]|uniref:RNA polymerase factor sigma-54 n=1 Tax=Bacillus sp. KH172YL63 TaxID=2709784 RepID=UPI0013E46760|nr:RNA polymerase factor sigma-54 [Bacillus sp. KH172YL63]BCB05605.1 RNA polymerase sigma-54 factor [Bacillus sp. KH172YL63]